MPVTPTRFILLRETLEEPQVLGQPVEAAGEYQRALFYRNIRAIGPGGSSGEEGFSLEKAIKLFNKVVDRVLDI